MNKTFTRIFSTLIIIAAFFAVTNNVQAQDKPPKMILLEEFTGAWCQFCPDGVVKIHEIMNNYSDNVIPLGVHYDDAMMNNDTYTLAAVYNPSYPAGMINRTIFNVNGQGTIALSRNIWQQAVTQVLSSGTTSNMGIEAKWSFDPATRQLNATVYARAYDDFKQNIHVFAYVIEKTVTGEGTGYDQVNAYNNSAGHPYSGKGNPIVGFEHENVVRAALGSVFGEEVAKAPFNEGNLAGTGWTWTVPDNVDPEDLEVVGVALQWTTQLAYNNIINSAYAEKTDALFLVESPSPDVQMIDVETTGNYEFTLTNKTDSPVTLGLSYEKSTRTPEEWDITASVNSGEVTLESGEAYTVNFVIALNGQIGLGDISYKVWNSDDETSQVASGSFTIYSTGIQRLLVDDGATEAIYLEGAESGGYDDIIVISSGEFTTNSDMFVDLKSAIWATGDAGTISVPETGAIRTLIDNQVGIVFTGTRLLASLNDNAPYIVNQLGVNEVEYCFIGYNQSTNFAVDLQGIASDPISKGIRLYGNLTYYLTVKFLIMEDEEIASPIFHYQGQPDSLAGFKSQMLFSRAVLYPALELYEERSDKDDLNTVIARSIEWVESSPALPDISFEKSTIYFGEVKVGEGKDMPFKIMNDGDGELLVSTAWIDDWGAGDEAYVIVDFPKDGLTIAPNQEATVTVRFQPKAQKTYDVHELVIESNDPVDSKEYIKLVGEGSNSGAAVGPIFTKSLDDYNIEFGDIVIGKTEKISFTISNTGDEDYQIGYTRLSENPFEVFELTRGGTSFGEYKDIKPSETYEFWVEFTPGEEKEYTAKLKLPVYLGPDDNEGTNHEFTITGKGIPGTSVDDGTEGIEGVLTLQAGPNPFSEQTTISYNVGSGVNHIELYVIDAAGRRIETLVDGIKTEGSYTVDFNSNMLSSGSYYVIGNADGTKVQLPVVINK